MDATKGPFDSGIPIFVDPTGLRRANQTTSSLVTLDVEGVPLRTTLANLLKQLGLIYQVQDGMLTITESSYPVLPPMVPGPLPLLDLSPPFYIRIGHCYFALLAASLGGAAGLFFFRTREGPQGR